MDNPSKPKKADSVNVSVNVNDNVNSLEVVSGDLVALSKKREEEFYQKLIPFVGKYPKSMIREFYDYWTEWDDRKKFMRWEINRKKGGVFEIARRLSTWSRKESLTIGKKEEVTIYKPAPKL